MIIYAIINGDLRGIIMDDIPNIIDIDGYCDELSQITNIDINSIRYIVLYNFASMYGCSQNNLSFTEALDNIESQIYSILEGPKTPTPKKRALATL